MPNADQSQPAPNTASEENPHDEQRIILELSLTDAWVIWTQLRLALDQTFNADGRHVDRAWWCVHDLEEQLFGPTFAKVTDPWFTFNQDQTP